MLKHLLFETRLGESLLSFVEKQLGIAVVDAGWLGQQRPTMAAAPNTVAVE